MSDETPTPGAPIAAAGTPSDGGPPADVAAMAFDAALGELQQVVARLESGNLPLEESIALYERGVALHDHCARLLSDAELRVQRLVQQAGGALRTIDLSPDDAEDEA